MQGATVEILSVLPYLIYWTLTKRLSSHPMRLIGKRLNTFEIDSKATTTVILQRIK